MSSTTERWLCNENCTGIRDLKDCESMPDLNTICPYQEKEIVIPERDIRMAIMFRSKCSGHVIITCPDCCKVIELTGTQPEDVDKWDPDINKMVCVPFLDDAALSIPAGFMQEVGETKYRPGSGGDSLPKREYMHAYGIDPECYYAKKLKRNR